MAAEAAVSELLIVTIASRYGLTNSPRGGVFHIGQFLQGHIVSTERRRP